MSTESTALDQRLRVATTALAEYDHLAQSRARLAQEVNAAFQRVQQLQAELAREQRDVQEMTSGVLGFLASLAMTNELEREQREAMEAAIRLREGNAAFEGLRDQLVQLDTRLASPPRTALEAEVSAIRSAKEAAMRQLGAPGGAQLVDLAIQMESIDIELVPLEDAVSAGTSAATKLFAILDVLDRKDVPPTKGQLGDAQAEITRFHRAVDALAASDDTRAPFSDAISLDDREPWVDPWLKNLFGKADRETRISDARTALLARLTRLKAQLEPVLARRDELAARRAGLQLQHDRMIDPT